MEQTLGKRIAGCRKRLGLTQDQLAEKLGVTAQAVSKWENDQSCPDITMLPRLSAIFEVSSDELLGIREPEKAAVPEVIASTEEEKEEKPDNRAELTFTSDRNSAMVFAIWALVTGGLLLLSTLLHWDVTFWDILWPSAILAFGVSGVVSDFSFFSLCCVLFGGFFMLCNLNLLPAGVDKSILLPVLLILFGLSLLVKAFRKPQKASLKFHLNGKDRGETSSYSEDEGSGSFFYNSNYCDDSIQVTLSTLRAGKVETNCGDVTLDLTTCGQIEDGSTLEIRCSFGDVEIRVPRKCRVVCNREGSFSSVEFSGSPDPDTAITLRADCTVNCGEVQFRYI